MQKMRDVFTYFLRKLCDAAASQPDITDAALNHLGASTLLLRTLIMDGRCDDIARQTAGAVAAEVVRMGTLALRPEESDGA